MNKALSDAFARLVPVIDQALHGYLPSEDSEPVSLSRAMNYSVFAGGKRFRPVLTILVNEALGGNGADALAAACALELVHTYSLIHDDLPAMDDDDLRRGKPTSHKVFGEATAILAGDALLTLAFEVAASSAPETQPARLVHEIAVGAGHAGMVAGQVADIESEGKGGGIDRVEYIHLRKTAALIRASAAVGAIATAASEDKVRLACDFGETLGLVFQIADDILDETASTAELGKTAGKDAASRKLTYPAVLGLAAARAHAAELARDASKLLEELAPDDTILRHLVSFVLERSS